MVSVHIPGTMEKRGGKCGCPIQRSCEKSKFLSKSLRRSPKAVRERLAVCGSDRKTYRSQHHLECSRQLNSRKCRVALICIHYHAYSRHTVTYVIRSNWILKICTKYITDYVCEIEPNRVRPPWKQRSMPRHPFAVPMASRTSAMRPCCVPQPECSPVRISAVNG